VPTTPGAVRDRFGERLLRCAGGLTIFAVGIALIIRADLGLAPWDVFHQGVSDRLGVGIGVVMIATGAAVLLLWIPLRVRPGLGTVLNVVMIGVVVDLVLPHLPEPDRLLPRAALLAAGIAVLAVGSALYIGAGLGPGPRDGLMTGLARRGLSIGFARTSVEVIVLIVGIALGGSAGIGTAVFAFGIGPMVQVLMPRLSMSPAAPRRELAPA